MCMVCLSMHAWEHSKKGAGNMLLPCSIDLCYQLTEGLQAAFQPIHTPLSSTYHFKNRSILGGKRTMGTMVQVLEPATEPLVGERGQRGTCFSDSG